jgi:hypothetical protein
MSGLRVRGAGGCFGTVTTENTEHTEEERRALRFHSVFFSVFRG